MSTDPQIQAAAIGAVIVWCFQLFDKLRDRCRGRQAALVAIASEVQALCHLIRSQRYLEEFHKLANQIRSNSWNSEKYVVDTRGNYFTIYTSNASHISDLHASQVSKIVSFYTYCQSAIDSTRPDGPIATSTDRNDIANNILAVEGVLMAILVLGDEIVKFPKKPLPVLEK